MCLVAPGLFLIGSFTPDKLTLYDTTEMKPVAHMYLQMDVNQDNMCLIPGDKVAVTSIWNKEDINKIVIVSAKNNQLQREHAIHIRPPHLTLTMNGQ